MKTTMHFLSGFVMMMIGAMVAHIKGHDDPSLVPVRLVHGPTAHEGLVEVYHDNSWGYICDDGWDDVDCMVVCNQLDHNGGKKTAGQIYGPGDGTIWLTEVVCSGTEKHIGECMHENWGVHNCDDRTHTEDAGCRCNLKVPTTQTITNPTWTPPWSNPTQTPSPGGGGGCGVGKVRITPFDAAMPGIGRVEVIDGVVWKAICDDFWDDMDAAVFCRCMGYTDTTLFRAYWTSRLASLSFIPFLWDAIHCEARHIGGDIHSCGTSPAGGRCSGPTEAAAVACSSLPHAAPAPPPETTLSCDGYFLKACFHSSHYSFKSQHMHVEPACSNAVNTDVAGGVCTNINMRLCATASQDTDQTYKHYCYNVSYSPFPSARSTLLMDTVWGRRACCSVEKNGNVTAFFKPQTVPDEQISIQAPISFSLQCFLNEKFDGTPLTFPATVQRGEDMFCRINADTWDKRMFLIVPNCRFTSSLTGGVVFQFMNNKCPTNQALNVSYFSFDGHNWGFKFVMPKFEGYDDLYLMCDSYVCDHELESKPYCDRSCSSNNVVGRRRRSIIAGLLSKNPMLHKLVEVQRGPFHVQDNGVGPVVLKDGHVELPSIPEVMRGDHYNLRPANEPSEKKTAFLDDHLKDEDNDDEVTVHLSKASDDETHPADSVDINRKRVKPSERAEKDGKGGGEKDGSVVVEGSVKRVSSSAGRETMSGVHIWFMCLATTALLLWI